METSPKISFTSAPSFGLLGRARNNLKTEFRHVIKQFPSIYIGLSRLRHKSNPDRELTDTSPEAVRADTEIVIEGPARSANTFAVVAFRLAQARPISIAYYLHASAQVTVATRLDIPVIVLLRNPEDVVLSRVVSHPPITMKQSLREYLYFYKGILPHRGQFVLAPFDSVTSNFGSVIARVNERFGTDFAEFRHTEENGARVLRLIEERQDALNIPAYRQAVPTEEKNARKAVLHHEYFSSALKDIRTQAEQHYKVLIPYGYD